MKSPYITGINTVLNPEHNNQNGTPLAATTPCNAPKVPNRAYKILKAQAIFPILVTHAGAFHAARHNPISIKVRSPIPNGPPCKK